MLALRCLFRINYISLQSDKQVITKKDSRNMRNMWYNESALKRKMLYVHKETTCSKNSKCLFRQENQKHISGDVTLCRQEARPQQSSRNFQEAEGHEALMRDLIRSEECAVPTSSCSLVFFQSIVVTSSEAVASSLKSAIVASMSPSFVHPVTGTSSESKVPSGSTTTCAAPWSAATWRGNVARSACAQIGSTCDWSPTTSTIALRSSPRRAPLHT